MRKKNWNIYFFYNSDYISLGNTVSWKKKMYHFKVVTAVCNGLKEFAGFACPRSQHKIFTTTVLYY
jgi:hypothetical protein